jgi:hypothetical protein
MFKFLFLESQNFHLNFKFPFESIPFQQPNISKGIPFLPFVLGPKFLSSPTQLSFIFHSIGQPSRTLGPTCPTVTFSYHQTKLRHSRCHHCPQATHRRLCAPAASLTGNRDATPFPTVPLHQPVLPHWLPSTPSKLKLVEALKPNNATSRSPP